MTVQRDEPERTHLVQVLGMWRAVPVAGTREARIARIAAFQRGRIARRQLDAAAVSRATIAWLVKRDRLFPCLRCVFAVGHSTPAELSRETEALLAVREGAALSHGSAAKVWGLGPASPPDHPVDVLVPGSGGALVPGVTVHRSRRLTRSDLRIRCHLPVVSPARVLLDLAAVWPERQTELALDRALVDRILRPAQLTELLDRSPGRAGVALLRDLVTSRGAPSLTRSEAEERLLALVRAARLPEPLVNARVGGYEVDFYWPEWRFAVEVDGYRFHSTRRAFEHDRRKDGELRDLGIDSMRVTWRQIEREPLALAARFGHALSPRAA